MKLSVRFEIEIWRMDLAYVVELAKDNNCVKYSQLRQDLFYRTVDANGWKTKVSRQTFGAV